MSAIARRTGLHCKTIRRYAERPRANRRAQFQAHLRERVAGYPEGRGANPVDAIRKMSAI
jgi:hypothetical protein